MRKRREEERARNRERRGNSTEEKRNESGLEKTGKVEAMNSAKEKLKENEYGTRTAACQQKVNKLTFVSILKHNCHTFFRVLAP